MTELALPVVLDGTYGEGGGALIRTALSMSALTLRPLRVQNVRGGTGFPGLSQEDISLIEALKQLTSAETVGVELKSQQFSFLPVKPMKGRDLELKLPESHQNPHQSACVLLATLAPLHANLGRYTTLTAHGETYGQNTLSYDAFAGVTIPAFRKFGLHTFPDMVQSGFGRGSAGELKLEVEPSELNAVNLKGRGALLHTQAVVSTGGLDRSIAIRGATHLERMAHHAGIKMQVETQVLQSKSPGAHITISSVYENGFGSGAAMGAKGLRIEAVAQKAFDKFSDWVRSGAALDEHVAEQIMVLACLSQGVTTFTVDKITERLTTTIWVIKQFMPISIVLKGKVGDPGLVTIKR